LTITQRCNLAVWNRKRHFSVAHVKTFSRWLKLANKTKAAIAAFVMKGMTKEVIEQINLLI